MKRSPSNSVSALAGRQRGPSFSTRLGRAKRGGDDSASRSAQTLSCVPTSILFLLLFFLSSLCQAQDPKVRTTLSAKDDFWVGQRITLVIELLAPGYFAGTPAFDLPSPPGLLLIPPTGSPVIGSEIAGDTTYTVQRHKLSVFAQRAGPQTIPTFTVRFRFKRQPLDKDEVPATVHTELLSFTVKQPPGTEKLGSVLSARDLNVVEEWHPEPGKAKAGDAFTRTITLTATEIPAMAFPPFRPGKIDGLGIYPKPPEVLDRGERGTMHGERRDVTNYLCQRPGQFIIPAVRFSWWNPDEKKLQTIELPRRVLDVAANPTQPSAIPLAPTSPRDWRQLRVWLAALILLAASAFAAHRLGIWPIVRRALSIWRPVHLAPLNPPSELRTTSSSPRYWTKVQ